jgi:tRNA(fMet)-specific endonuclease VapC
MDTRFLLDTNTASDIIREQDPTIRANVAAVPAGALWLSSISQAELLFGLEKRGHPKELSRLVHAFLLRVTVSPWNVDSAVSYASLRHRLERAGTPLAAMDLLIAAQAVALSATLVTSDRAFRRIKGLAVVDWRKP